MIIIYFIIMYKDKNYIYLKILELKLIYSFYIIYILLIK